ncbi:MAG TPA: very short patch repair endonuclease [Chloroflexi bacterium]|nr:very short patch repair endonuclease [Chloroflexota bacterium]
MPDVFSSTDRSRIMSKVKNRDTAPKLVVRRLLHRLGYRFRLHRANLPGHPDIVLPRHRKVIFVHGCFWHGHVGCPRGARPATNTEFWNAKLDANARRDKSTQEALDKLGWRILIVWQCETRNETRLAAIIEQFLAAAQTPVTDSIGDGANGSGGIAGNEFSRRLSR